MTTKNLIEAGDPEEANVVNKVAVRSLIFTGLIIITPGITPAMAITFSAIAIPQMTLTLSDASWFASIGSISCPIGNFLIGIILDKYGRKMAFILSIIPSIFGWFLLINPGASIARLFTGRLLTGFALGAASLPSLIYAAECVTINNHDVRSSFGTLSSLAMYAGEMLMFFLAIMMPYYKVALVAGWLSIISLLLIVFFIPESPSWLYKRGRIGDAEVAQIKLGIKQPILQNQKTRELSTVPAESPDTQKDLTQYINQIKLPEVYKPLILTISFLFFAQFSGIYCLSAYMVDIIRVDVASSNPYVLSTISVLLDMLGTTSLMFTLPYCGMRKLAVVSLIGVATGFTLLGITEWVPLSYARISSVFLVSLFSGMGLSSIPYTMLGELFPMGAKGYASLSLVASSTFNFIVLKAYLYAYTGFGAMVYFVFAVINVCGAVFVFTCLPETVGKTMDEIRAQFKHIKKLKQVHNGHPGI